MFLKKALKKHLHHGRLVQILTVHLVALALISLGFLIAVFVREIVLIPYLADSYLDLVLFVAVAPGSIVWIIAARLTVDAMWDLFFINSIFGFEEYQFTNRYLATIHRWSGKHKKTAEPKPRRSDL